MKKIALLGDSIRQLGYGTKVPELLGGEYTVFQPNDNCRFVKYTLRGLFDWKEQLDGSDVIHWNNGLWDTAVNLFDDGKPFTEEGEYVENMLRVARLLKKMSKRVIFATTTPVRPDYPYNDNVIIDRYNAVLVPKLKEMGIVLNDLNALVKPHIYEYIREDDKIHLTEKGIEACAKQVAACIVKG
ncbi:MAG: SGNH/GDSL hydrolase family protein [Clostridia bacterium]|nr:SGNH/GDSL hydrolase family protein [Clostridia bacterium]